MLKLNVKVKTGFGLSYYSFYSSEIEIASLHALLFKGLIMKRQCCPIISAKHGRSDPCMHRPCLLLLS